MATPRVLRFDAEGRPLEFSVWLLRARRLLESQVQAHKTLWAHASGDVPGPTGPAPLAVDPTPADSDRYACEHADVTTWKSRDAAACIALRSLLPESEETHFTQVRTASEFLTAIKARYATSTTVSLGRLFLPFLFPYLALFERTADLPRFDVESNLRSVASASGVVPPPLFHGCTVPQLPTFTTSLATAATDVTAATVTTSSGLGVGVAGGAVRVWAEAVGVTWRAVAAGVQGLEKCLVQRLVTPLLQLVEVTPGFVSHLLVCQPKGVEQRRGDAPEDASLSFTLDSGASHCFSRDRTKLTPLPTPVSVALADPTSGPVTARYTTTLPCPAVPSGSLTGFHVPSFSRNLVGVRPLVSQHVDVWIEPSGKTAVCVDGDTAAAAAAAATAAATAAVAAAAAAAAIAATAPDSCHCPSSGSHVSPGCCVSPGSCVWSGSSVWSNCYVVLLPVACPPHCLVAPPDGAPVSECENEEVND
ncbi:unnamed protein product [Closterium sp. NIES-53]